MEGSEFDEIEFFRAIETSGTRALLIGRRALVVLGLPVLTAEYDFWIHIDDAVAFNRAAQPFGLVLHGLRKRRAVEVVISSRIWRRSTF